MNNKEKSIQTIEGLYPPDSNYIETAKVGEKLLIHAKNKFKRTDWRDESKEVLAVFADLCIQLDRGSGSLNVLVKE